MLNVDFKEMLKYVLCVIEGIPNGMAEMEIEPGIDGFMKATKFDSDVRKRIDEEFEKTTLGVRILHDSNLYGTIMYNMFDIASLGWDVYVAIELLHEE